MPIRKTISVSESEALLNAVFDAIDAHSCAMVLLSNTATKDSFEWLAAIGKKAEFISKEKKNLFEELATFLDEKKRWTFGHFTYDLKNSIEQLTSKHPDEIQFPALSFFVPEVLLIKTKNEFTLESDDLNVEKKLLDSQSIPKEKINQKINILPRTSKTKYLSDVNSILEHIHRGDIYELNYCIEFFAENISIDPVAVFKKLNQLAEAPFSVLYKNEDCWLLCVSPERFIRKEGRKLISQPIKGTRPRGKDEQTDQQQKEDLQTDPKERSENVMIVDLVRNDLSRSAVKGSVKVEELFGLHTFKNVHQLISTVVAELDPEIHPVAAIKNAFPMGSMTGAPKIRAMELIEEFENRSRALYSGAIGYFSPEMDFDFNVVIRSIQYNSKTGYLSLMVGSAITVNSDPEKEYAECLVKAETLFQALGVELKD